MASPCEILLATESRSLAEALLQQSYTEAKRIEHKFSRYRSDNCIYRINHSDGTAVSVDEETANLLDFAEQCYHLSEHKFDITSGVLREVWKFDGSDNVPDPAAVASILPRVGWDKIEWRRPVITLRPGMEIDLGGIGKEYAVDQTAQLIFRKLKTGALINYGGDLFALGPRQNGEPWGVGVDDPEATGINQIGAVNLSKGGLATSGDARRYLLKDGIRYSHILDPTTGWPVPDAPRAVTVVASTCLEAGMLSTMAMLQGAQARSFLEAQEVDFWCT
ncbi:MAG TPA: FAD:protein FMN transferase [Gammaproteobacteria bacterium]|nr:FAD:protein FMN transferase [Gammaproteobacteria bacterium]